MEMLDALGVHWLETKTLAATASSLSEPLVLRPRRSIPPRQKHELTLNAESNVIYAVQILPEDIFRDQNGSYDRSIYYAKPQAYKSQFWTSIAPHLTTLVNGIGWKPGFPRMISDDDLKAANTEGGSATNQKLIAVQDITCDIKVSLGELHSTEPISGQSRVHGSAHDNRSATFRGTQRYDGQLD